MSDEASKRVILIPISIDIEHADDCPANPKNQGKSGPSKVTTDAYRSGWDTIFGGKTTVGDA